MNAIERIKMLKAMEFICRNLNDEDIFYDWLTCGIADGDIDYGDLAIMKDDPETLEYYLDDTAFADLMNTFIHLMKAACKSGGLYCDDVVSKEEAYR